MSRSSWDRRIERARELEQQYPAAAEVLRFYREIAGFQKALSEKIPPLEMEQRMPPLLELIERTGPALLAAEARELAQNRETWKDLPADSFFVRVLLQPLTEHAAQLYTPQPDAVRAECPSCGEQPVAAVLRPEGEGGKRKLLCSLCFTEWDFRRLLCPNCGEEDRDKLPVFTAGEFPHVRVEACDSCQRYIKAIDMTRNGLAVPEVDEMAALSLDLWAAEKGYTKLKTNLLGL